MKSRINNVKSMVQVYSRQICFGLTVFTGVIAFFCFFYSDILITVEHSFNLIDCLLRGEFLSFYQYAIEHNSYSQPAVYDFPIYVIFAIWNLPIYVIAKLTGIDYLNSLPCLIWIKSMLVVWVWASLYYVKNICAEIKIDETDNEWVSSFYISSVFLIVPVLILTQYDIISITLMLSGILGYIRKDEKRFVFSFMFAITMKLFAVFIFIPLLLLREKNLIKIVIKMLEGMIFLLFCKILFGGQAAYKSSTSSFSNDMLNRLQISSIQWIFPEYTIPIFFVLLFGVCVFCFANKCNDDTELNLFAIYIPYVVFGGFISLIQINLYWMVLFAPFSTILILKNKNYLKLNLLLDTFLGGAIIFVLSTLTWWVLCVGIVKPMCLSRLKFLAVDPKYFSINDIWKSVGLDSFCNIFGALVVVCFISGAVLNYPKRIIGSDIDNNECKMSFMWIRLIPSVMVMLLVLVVYFYPAERCIYSSVDNQNVVKSNNLLEGEGAVEQLISFSEESEVDEIKLYVLAEGYTWMESTIIKVLICENDNCVFEDEIAANTIKDGEIKLGLNGYNFAANTPYSIVISAYNYCDKPIYVMMNSQRNEYITVQSGKQLESDLMMEIKK